MIAGLETITSGELSIGGISANDLLPSERNISVVFQSYALFPNMTQAVAKQGSGFRSWGRRSE